jgi:hypothetical protein
MPYLILGVALLAGFLLAGRWFSTAGPKTLVKTFKWLLIGSIIAIALFFLKTGRVAWAIAALPALLPWFIRLRRAARTAKAFRRMSQRGGGRPSGQTSAVNTRYLHMELDHDSGAMWGTVVSGAHTGSDLHDLNDVTIVQLLAECRSNDPESAQILEAYLDRQRPNWRNTDGAHQNHNTNRDGLANSTSGTMSHDEAYEVLGLEGGAPMDAVREAHRRLIAHLHPDKGGSTFLATKVNQAKDVLLNE